MVVLLLTTRSSVSEVNGTQQPRSQDLLRTIQCYYSNAYIDAKKQDIINVFLGHFQPQQGKPALWKLDSDEHYNVGRQRMVNEENGRSFIVKSLSNGNILSTCNGKSKIGKPELLLEVQQLDDIREASNSAPKMSWCLDEPSCPRSENLPSFPCQPSESFSLFMSVIWC